MEDEVIVACHAPVLSLLLFETARSVHDQKGLLLGQVFREVISKKTDDNEINQEHKTVIYIKHSMPILNNEVFGKVGDINRTELQRLTDPKKIVGWYSFRRNTRANLNTLNELLIHKTLLEILPNCNPELFVAAFMSANTVPSGSTHAFNHVFTRFQPTRERFEPIKLKIYSLSDKSVNSSSAKSFFPLSSRFERIVAGFQEEENPVKSVLAVHDKVGELLKMFNAKLQEQENIRSELENEVKELKKTLGLDQKQDIVIQEEPEKEDFPQAQFIQFDPNKRYNPNRIGNPIKVSSISPVPDDDDDEEDNNEIIDVDSSDEKEEKPKESSQSEPLMSYASMLNKKTASPVFNVKTPRYRPGLSPHVNAKSPSEPNNRRDAPSPDIIADSGDENDENSEKKLAAVNNSQNSNQMETDH